MNCLGMTPKLPSQLMGGPPAAVLSDGSLGLWVVSAKPRRRNLRAHEQGAAAADRKAPNRIVQRIAPVRCQLTLGRARRYRCHFPPPNVSAHRIPHEESRVKRSRGAGATNRLVALQWIART